MQRVRFPVLIIALVITVLMFLPGQYNQSEAQPRITDTSLPVVIPTTAPTNTPRSLTNPIIEPSPSPTFTATQPLPDARLVSVAAPGTALIRDFPENGTVLGVLLDNTQYQVLGYYFSWYQIQYRDAQNGTAWVYLDDIQVSGNIQEIPFIDPNNQPVQLSAQDLASQTAFARFQTPGVAETATAESRVLEIGETQVSNPVGNSEFPQLYTEPAEIVPLQTLPPGNSNLTPAIQQDIVDFTLDSVSKGNIPPILPILVLFIAGVLGMMIAGLRN